MRPCSICEHPKRLDLDAALIEGESVRSVAQRFQVTKSAVERHKNGHLKPQLRAKAVRASNTPSSRSLAVANGQAAPTIDDLLSLEGVLGRLVRNLERLEAAADDAADSGMHQGLAAVSGQLTRSIEMVCRLKGHFQEPSGPPAQSQFGVVIILPDGTAPGRAANVPAERASPTAPPTLRFEFDGGLARKPEPPAGPGDWMQTLPGSGRSE